MNKCDGCGNFNGVRCQLLGTCPYPDVSSINSFTNLTVGKGSPLNDKNMLNRITQLENTVKVLVECVDALLATKIKKQSKNEYDPSQDVRPLIRSRCHEGRGEIPADTKPPRTR